MAVILPFEKPFFEKAHIPVTFVGHPLLDSEHLSDTRVNEKTNHETPVIGLLPGSRGGEIGRHLPVMLEAAQVLSKRVEGITFIVSVAPMVDRSVIEKIIQQKGRGIDLLIEAADIRRVFSKCHLVVAASGTVTLEAAIAGIPSVVIYRVSPISYWLGKALIQVDYICLANLIADKPIYPELIQSDASAEHIADKVVEIISDSGKRDRMKEDLSAVRKALGGPGASRRVADIALNMLK